MVQGPNELIDIIIIIVRTNKRTAVVNRELESR